MILSADLVLPISSEPIPNGAVVVDGTTIAAVGTDGDLCSRFPSHSRRHLTGCVLLPGLVNAHTHLCLTLLKGRLQSRMDFISWILALIQEKKRMSRQEIHGSIRSGLDQSLDAGTTCLGDITDDPMAPLLFRERGVRGTLFLEVLGKERVDPPEWEIGITQQIRSLQSEAGDRIAIGVSPHTAYTLSAQKLGLLSNLLAKTRLRFSIHVAESSQEMEYFLHHSGEIISRFFPAIGWHDSPLPETLKTPLAYLDDFSLVTDRLVIVHGVHLTRKDIDLVQRRGSCLVLCPRSNDFLNVGSAPVEELADRGVPMALGTDSLASNTSLSIWEEMRHLRNVYKDSPRLSSSKILEMATLGGAAALGMESVIGSLEVGKEADLIAAEFPDCDPSDPVAGLIEQTENRQVRLVMVAGRILKDTFG